MCRVSYGRGDREGDEKEKEKGLNLGHVFPWFGFI